MKNIPAAALEVLESDRLAHIVTVNSDGSPQISCVWVGVDDGEIVFASMPRNRKVQNIERDSRVVLSIETDRRDANGLNEYLVVRGHARVVPGGAPQLLQRLAAVYIGSGVKFPAMPNPPPGYVIRITPVGFGGNGPWAGERPPEGLWFGYPRLITRLIPTKISEFRAVALMIVTIWAMGGCATAPVAASPKVVSSPTIGSPAQISPSAQPKRTPGGIPASSPVPRESPGPITGPPKTISITFVLVVHGAVPPLDGLSLDFFYPGAGEAGFLFCDSTPARPCNVPGAVLDLDFPGLSPLPVPVRYVYYLERRGQNAQAIASGAIYLNTSSTVSAAVNFT